MSRPPHGGRRPGGAHLSTTARTILAEFADSFPDSAHFRGGRKLRKGGWHRVFPGLDTDVETKEAFLDAVDELVGLGLVSVRWRRFREGSEVDALYLEDAERLFAFVGRASPQEVREEMLAVLRSDAWTAPADPALRDVQAAVRTHLAAALEERHPVPAGDAAELRDLACLFAVSPAEARLVPLRALSVRLYRDSKRLEALLPVADRLTRRAAGVAISAELGLARSYPEASLALRGRLVFAASRPQRWVCAGRAVTLPAATVDEILAIEFSGPTPAVLSVENKETFHTLAERLRTGALPPPFEAVAYCGGHPHAAYIGLLSRCATAGAELYHFGDLDPDGLLILAELDRAFDAEVRPFLMDVSTYRAYLPYGYRPPEARLELLAASQSSLPAAVRPLAAEILAHGRGVEQEVIAVGATGRQ